MAELRKRYPRTRFDRDRHGNERWYTLDPEGRKIRMRAPAGSAEWVKEWEEIRAGKHIADRAFSAGTLGALITAYMRSPEWAELAVNTQKARRRILHKVKSANGEMIAAEITSADIRAGRNARQDTPAAANVHMKVLSALFSWGEENGLVTHNPVRGVKRLKMRQGGFHSWSVEECLQFEARFPVGTMARAVYALALYAAPRGVDIRRLGPQHVTPDGFLAIPQQKTGELVEIPICQDLADALAPLAPGMVFILNAYGKPYSEKGIGQRFAKWCEQAGLPSQCRLHGLRKACAARLAESGCTEEEIMAILGHMSPGEIRPYVRAVNRRKLARRAVNKRDQNVPL